MNEKMPFVIAFDKRLFCLEEINGDQELYIRGKLNVA